MIAQKARFRQQISKTRRALSAMKDAGKRRRRQSVLVLISGLTALVFTPPILRDVMAALSNGK